MSKSSPLIFENSHEDGSVAALQMLVSDIFTWELMYQLAQFAIKVLVTNYQNVIVAANGGNKKKIGDDAKTTLIDRGPSYVVSLVHSMYVTTRGLMHLYYLWDASNIQKMHIGSADDYHWVHLEVAKTNIMFLAYLLYDLVHIIMQYPKLGGFDTIMHHTLFALCSMINGTYGIMAFQFGWLITGEASTVFLNWRWFLLKSNRDSGTLIDNVNNMFAASFFLCRVVMYTAGIIHLYIFSLPELKSLVQPEFSGVPVSLLGITCGCMLLGWVLNLFWSTKILSKVTAGRGSNTKNRRGKRD